LELQCGLKKTLDTYDKVKLIDLIADLYTKNKSVKEYLDFSMNSNEEEILKSYKQKVEEAFFPKRGMNFKLADGKKAISDFRKLKPTTKSVADLMMCYVESGVKFTRKYGDIDERFYSSLESVFNDCLGLIYKNFLQEEFKDRADQILEDTEDIGWGFHDSLSYSYGECFG